jgi:hypothetical protein
VTLDRRLGTIVGWTGFASASDAQLDTADAMETGYPADKTPLNSMWGSYGYIDDYNSHEVNYTDDDFPGDSGAGLWSTGFAIGMPYAVASRDETYVCLNLPPTCTDNAATRLTNAMFDAFTNEIAANMSLPEVSTNPFSWSYDSNEQTTLRPVTLLNTQGGFPTRQYTAFETVHEEDSSQEHVRMWTQNVDGTRTFSDLLRAGDSSVSGGHLVESGVAAAWRKPSTIDIAYTTMGGHVQWRTFTNAWSDPIELDGPGASVDTPAIISRTPTTVDFFTRRKTLGINHYRYNGTTLDPAESIAGNTWGGPPVVVSRTSSTMDVFVKSGGNRNSDGTIADGAIWTKSWDGANWLSGSAGSSVSQTHWTSLGKPNNYSDMGSPVAVAMNANRIDVFSLDMTTKTPWVITWTASGSGGSWGSWRSLGGTILSTLAVVLEPPGNTVYDIFGVGGDRAAWQQTWDTANPNPNKQWTSRAGDISDVSATSGIDRINLVGRSANNSPRYRTLTRTNGGPWQ